MRSLSLAAALVLSAGIFALATFAQEKAQGKGKQDKAAIAAIDWNKPFPPHKVIGNVYSVGSEQLGSFLIASAPTPHPITSEPPSKNSASNSPTSKSCWGATRIRTI